MKHLLIDFENGYPPHLEHFSPHNSHIWLFYGAQQKQLPIIFNQQLMLYGKHLHYDF